MVTEMITLKLERKFLKEADQIVKENGYQNRTELIRTALREKVDEIKLKETMKQLAKFKGSSKRKTTEEEYEKARQQAFEEISRELDSK